MAQRPSGGGLCRARRGAVSPAAGAGHGAGGRGFARLSLRAEPWCWRAMFLDKDKLVAAMRGNGALSWGEHHPCLFGGTERFFRPGYRAHLVAEWLPALDGVVPKLEAGATVADVGAGMAPRQSLWRRRTPHRASSASTITHPPSTRPQRAADVGVAERVTFAQATAKRYRPELRSDVLLRLPPRMGDPVGAARHANQALNRTGRLLVEPFAGIGSTRTPTQSAACSMRPRRSSVRRIRCPKRSASGWAHRQANLGCGMYSSRRVLPVSAGRRTRRSISF